MTFSLHWDLKIENKLRRSQDKVGDLLPLCKYYQLSLAPLYVPGQHSGFRVLHRQCENPVPIGYKVNRDGFYFSCANLDAEKNLN